jgi:anti-sigma B factor antagonist
MEFTQNKQGNAVVFTLNHSTFDSLISSEFKAEILKLTKEKIKNLVLDLSQVTYIDSSGIGAMLFTHRQSKDYKFTITIAGINNTVLKMFRISNIDVFFEFSATAEDAL